MSSFEQAEIVASIPAQWRSNPSYYHSFGITKDYFVFLEQPFCFNLSKLLLNHFIGRPAKDSLSWFPKEKVTQQKKRNLVLCYNINIFSDQYTGYKIKMLTNLTDDRIIQTQQSDQLPRAHRRSSAWLSGAPGSCWRPSGAPKRSSPSTMSTLTWRTGSSSWTPAAWRTER